MLNEIKWITTEYLSTIFIYEAVCPSLRSGQTTSAPCLEACPSPSNHPASHHLRPPHQPLTNPYLLPNPIHLTPARPTNHLDPISTTQNEPIHYYFHPKCIFRSILNPLWTPFCSLCAKTLMFFSVFGWWVNLVPNKNDQKWGFLFRNLTFWNLSG